MVILIADHYHVCNVLFDASTYTNRKGFIMANLNLSTFHFRSLDVTKGKDIAGEKVFTLSLDSWGLDRKVNLCFTTKHSNNPLPQTTLGTYRWAKLLVPEIRIQLYENPQETRKVHRGGIEGTLYHELSHHLSTLAAYCEADEGLWRGGTRNVEGRCTHGHGIHPRMYQLYDKHKGSFCDAYADKNPKEATAEVFRVLHGFSSPHDLGWVTKPMLQDYLGWFKSCPIYSEAIPGCTMISAISSLYESVAREWESWGMYPTY